MKDSCVFEGWGQQPLAVGPFERQRVDVPSGLPDGLPMHDPDLYAERRFGYANVLLPI